MSEPANNPSPSAPVLPNKSDSAELLYQNPAAVVPNPGPRPSSNSVESDTGSQSESECELELDGIPRNGQPHPHLSRIQYSSINPFETLAPRQAKTTLHRPESRSMPPSRNSVGDDHAGTTGNGRGSTSDGEHSGSSK